MIGLLNAHSLLGFQSDAITFRVILNCTFGGEKKSLGLIRSVCLSTFLTKHDISDTDKS